MPQKYRKAINPTGTTLLEHIYARVKTAGYPTYVLTPDKQVMKWCRKKRLSFHHFKPAFRSLMLELLAAAIQRSAHVVVLVTGDSVATEAQDIQHVVKQVLETGKPAGTFRAKGAEVRGCTVANLLYLADYLQAVHEHGLAAFFPNDSAEPLPNLSVDTEEDRQRIIRMFRRVPLTASVEEMTAALKSEEPVCLPSTVESPASKSASETPSSTSSTSTVPATPSS